MLPSLPALTHRIDPRTLALALAVFTGLLLAYLQVVGGLPGEQAVALWARRIMLPPVVRDICFFFGALGTPTVALLTVLAFLRLAHRKIGVDGVRFLLAAVGGPIVAT